jgi:hypothetical protein
VGQPHRPVSGESAHFGFVPAAGLPRPLRHPQESLGGRGPTQPPRLPPRPLASCPMPWWWPAACTVPRRPRRQPYPVEIQALTLRSPNHRASYHPCDASCQKGPPDASQNPEPRTQPIEKEELKTSRITTSHTGQDASQGWDAGPVWGSRSRVSTGGQSAMTTGAADRRISRLGPEIPKTVKHPKRLKGPNSG